jgi:hypothetical protein
MNNVLQKVALLITNGLHAVNKKSAFLELHISIANISINVRRFVRIVT